MSSSYLAAVSIRTADAIQRDAAFSQLLARYRDEQHAARLLPLIMRRYRVRFEAPVHSDEAMRVSLILRGGYCEAQPSTAHALCFEADLPTAAVLNEVRVRAVTDRTTSERGVPAFSVWGCGRGAEAADAAAVAADDAEWVRIVEHPAYSGSAMEVRCFALRNVPRAMAMSAAVLSRGSKPRAHRMPAAPASLANSCAAPRPC